MLAGLGLVVTVGGIAWLVFSASLGSGVASGWLLPGAITAAGGVVLLGSLGWLAERGVWARQQLPEERYRGPSIILLFVLAVAAANVLSLPPLLADALAGGDLTEPSTFALIVLLLVTPLIFGAVGALFVIRPRALVGARFGDGPATIRNVARGVALGAAAWVAANAVAIALAWLVTELTGEAPDEGQVVAEMAKTLPPLVAIALIGLLAPVAEEFFFRWIAVNAWEREHGTRVAVLGSAVLFGGAHILGGSWLALPSIILLGVILAGAYVATRSLPLVIGVHATFNCLSLAVIFLVPS
ncbi:MAG TPA: type II CAAX endopeptidase family protein [Candidatus Limnocylindria bacterium]|nr:type II CAAX endopeptidase family protein [Candidatus Limnocylindria bacterium]